MRVNANAVLRSWTLLAAFGGSYAPGLTHQTCLKFLVVHQDIVRCCDTDNLRRIVNVEAKWVLTV